MALTKYRLGDLIKQSDERNSNNTYGLSNLKGMSVKKEFIETKADMKGVSLTPYLLVKPDYFSYVTVTSRNSEKITLAHNTSNETYIVSSSYIVFFIKKKDVLLSDYLFLYFNRPEFDRYTRFNSWGSARETFSFEDMCDMEIELPPIEIQQKYVDIYNAMLANQKAYEQGLDDLKITIDSHLDIAKINADYKQVSELLTEVDTRNDDGMIKDVYGINITKQFIPTVANTSGVDLNNYKVVRKGQLAFSGMQTGRDECIRIALCDDEAKIISPAYFVFKVTNSVVLPEYLMMWFSRKESDRLGWFMSDSSIRSNLDLERFYETKIPLPEIGVQKSLVSLFTVYNVRKQISEQLKSQIKNICPILIKGSLQEGK